MPEGKKRSYDNSRRSAQARLTRTEIYRAAFRLFGEQGYASTSLPQIAAAAGVSVETVRKLGPKSGLLDGAREVAVFDESGVDEVLDTTFLRSVAAQEDLAGAVDVLVDFYATSNQRAAAFWQAWRAAAVGDPVVAAAWEREMTSAHGAFRTGIEYAAGRGWLRQDVSVDELAATLWVLAASETYTRLTVDAGFTDDDYRSWLRRMLLEQLAPR